LALLSCRRSGDRSVLDCEPIGREHLDDEPQLSESVQRVGARRGDAGVFGHSTGWYEHEVRVVPMTHGVDRLMECSPG
jgi:hypothetical protein